MKQPPLPKPDAVEVDWDEWDEAVSSFVNLPESDQELKHLILVGDAVNTLAESLRKHLKIRNEALAYHVAKKCIADLMERQ